MAMLKKERYKVKQRVLKEVILLSISSSILLFEGEDDSSIFVVKRIKERGCVFIFLQINFDYRDLFEDICAQTWEMQIDGSIGAGRKLDFPAKYNHILVL